MINKSTLEKILENIKLLSENERETLTSEIYVDILAERKYNLLSVVMEIVGVHPPEDIVQEAYKKEIEDSSKFIELYKTTGIRPPEEVIQQAYLSYSKFYTQFKQLIETFKSRPSSRAIGRAEDSCYFVYTTGNRPLGYGPDIVASRRDEEKWNKFKKLFKKAGVDFPVIIF